MTGSGDGHGPANAHARVKIGPFGKKAYAPALAMLLIASLTSGCSSNSNRSSWLSNPFASKVSPTLGVSASKRVYAGRAGRTYDGDLPKGGGHRKIGSPYKIAGRWYTPQEDPTYDRVGIASWYGSDFHARLTANGEVYDMNALTAAHKTLPLPSYAYVTNQSNGRTVLVRINDRGPYAGNRIIDLSRATARALGMEQTGLSKVRVQYAGPAPLDGNDYHERKFLAAQRWQQPHSIALARARQRQLQGTSDSVRRQSIGRTQSYQSQYARSDRGWDPHAYRQSLGR